MFEKFFIFWHKSAVYHSLPQQILSTSQNRSCRPLRTAYSSVKLYFYHPRSVAKRAKVMFSQESVILSTLGGGSAFWGGLPSWGFCLLGGLSSGGVCLLRGSDGGGGESAYLVLNDVTFPSLVTAADLFARHVASSLAGTDLTPVYLSLSRLVMLSSVTTSTALGVQGTDLKDHVM